MWHIIDKHDLIGTSMSMLSDAVGSLDGARGIPSAIRKATTTMTTTRTSWEVLAQRAYHPNR
jgi:hypothetical protein